MSFTQAYPPPVSTFPRPRRPVPWVARFTVVALTIFAAISSSTVVVGLDPAEQLEPIQAQPGVGDAVAAITAQPERPEQPAPPPNAIPDDPCTEYLADFCVEVPRPAPTRLDIVPACTTGESSDPHGSLTIVPGTSTGIPADAVRVRVELEDGIAVDGDCFAAAALGVLTDQRGWSSVESVSFAQVDDNSYDLRLILASPSTTDSLCHPARTAGKFSCRRGNRVVINLMRWQSGTDDYVGDLSTYRSYLINHEVGHFLGNGHRSCPAPGEPAPVMMQQTKGLGECLPNGWPTKDEH